MIPNNVTLTFAQGTLQGKECIFEDPSLCVIGRSSSCDLPVPSDLFHADISRRHCLLEIDPPAIRIHDLNSRNGTFVNGVRIPRPLDTHADESAAAGAVSGYELKDGDEVQLGKVRFKVTVNKHSAMPVPLLFV
jgi:pSer/pThr/pTyr-binding forkhead associated (FHA) protein